MPLIAQASKPRSVLISTDFSAASEKALRHALEIARFYESKLCLAHVVSSLGLTMAGPSAIAASEDAASRQSADLEESLLRTDALTGVQHKFVVRHGELWPELRQIMQDERSDLVVLGAHGRRGLRKLLFGSVTEKVLRQADCPVLTFGPKSDERSWIGTSSRRRTFLFVADTADGYHAALPHAVAVANHFEAKLVFFSIVAPPALPQCNCWHSADDIRTLREETLARGYERLEELATKVILDVKPQFYAEFASIMPARQTIVEAADRLRADLIIMGVLHTAHADLASHLVSSTAYKVICDATAPVLTVKSSGELRIQFGGPKAIESSLSDADMIRLHGLGVKG